MAKNDREWPAADVHEENGVVFEYQEVEEMPHRRFGGYSIARKGRNNWFLKIVGQLEPYGKTLRFKAPSYKHALSMQAALSGAVGRTLKGRESYERFFSGDLRKLAFITSLVPVGENAKCRPVKYHDGEVYLYVQRIERKEEEDGKRSGK